ncbi:hypothetical protein MMC27_005743, partial [Xylographa pallens]|nr:hypothetical protein [Xylographa pallens]
TIYTYTTVTMGSSSGAIASTSLKSADIETVVYPGGPYVLEETAIDFGVTLYVVPITKSHLANPVTGLTLRTTTLSQPSFQNPLGSIAPPGER